jgi:uncharacterized phage protein gp47/JayE
MYEAITYEILLQRMLDRVPSNFDKREGSVIWNALAPAAVELQLMYIELDTILSESFGDTASRDFLIRRAAERGIIPNPATYAVLQGEFTPDTLEIPIGSRFSLNELNYYVKSKVSGGVYQVECETLGEIGNQYFGNMIPIEYIDGLETAELIEVLIPGEDEEATESLRTKYFNSFYEKGYGGNVQDYLDKTNDLASVGSTKVVPIWDGGGTVKLVILNSSFDKASSALVEAVQEAIDPAPQGEGWGIAPIGHTVTVETVTEVEIDITADFTLDGGYTWEMISNQAAEKLAAYLLELREDWADQDNLIVRVSQFETRMLSIEGIVDVSGTTINGNAANLTLTAFQIPIAGSITAT